MTQEHSEEREERAYAAYLLRLWRERSDEPAPWRASLQDPHSGARLGFACLADLFSFLQRETEDTADATSEHPSP
jgi:hypothetical protein